MLGVRQNNNLTSGAPLTAQASPNLRGYKSGEYLGENFSSLEVEERVHLARRWGATLFVGVGCLYGDGMACSDDENIFPSYGVGIQFILKAKDGIVGNLEYARGKGDNEGLYMRGGYSFLKGSPTLREGKRPHNTRVDPACYFSRRRPKNPRLKQLR